MSSAVVEETPAITTTGSIAMDEVAVCCVATGQHYVRGLFRLKSSIEKHAPGAKFFPWINEMPSGSRPHSEFPYQFKSHAMLRAKLLGYRKILWADSSIVAVGSLEQIFRHAAKYGAWISDNGWTTAQWCPDSAYPYLFPREPIESARKIAETIKHPVATAFAVDLEHAVGEMVFSEYFRLCQTEAICGPWENGPPLPGDEGKRNPRKGHCGPSSTRGARHDQLILGVVAWQLGVPLTSPPGYFCYAGGQRSDTYLVADGGHTIQI